MSDYYETIVDRDALVRRAADEAAFVVKWLVAQKIIVGKPDDECVPRDEAPGYRAGPEAEMATDGQSCEDIRTSDGWVGMSVLIGRRFFEGDLSSEIEVFCPSCRAKSAAKKPWKLAADNWLNGKSPYQVKCQRCGLSTKITEWVCDPPNVFGNVGFRFWNWPPLSASFLSRLSQSLGHRLVLTQTSL